MPKRSAFDAERLSQVLRSQHNVITRQQALLCGLPPSTLDRYIAPGGRWQRLLPGVYLGLTGAATQDQREMAASLYAGPAQPDHRVGRGAPPSAEPAGAEPDRRADPVDRPAT